MSGGGSLVGNFMLGKRGLLTLGRGMRKSREVMSIITGASL